MLYGKQSIQSFSYLTLGKDHVLPILLASLDTVMAYPCKESNTGCPTGKDVPVLN
jgi:hypothetical protein